MLEWTICSNCGKIFDNSQETCPTCNVSVDRVHMDYLTGYWVNLDFLIKTISIFNDYCPTIRNLGERSVESVLADDMFSWLSYLACADGKITDNELEFINALLVSDFTKDDLTSSRPDTLPLSFRCLHELDEYGQSFDMNSLNSASELFSCYKLFGKFFITSDKKIRHRFKADSVSPNRYRREQGNYRRAEALP